MFSIFPCGKVTRTTYLEHRNEALSSLGESFPGVVVVSGVAKTSIKRRSPTGDNRFSEPLST